jgi:hypothetical protein
VLSEKLLQLQQLKESNDQDEARLAQAYQLCQSMSTIAPPQP